MAGTPRGLIERFEQAYHRSPDLFRAPGRVNLIGEHTDYNLGLVLPIAIDLACYAASAPNGDAMLRVHSVNLQQSREWPVSQLSQIQPRGDWADYIIGIARELGLARGSDLIVESTVPIGSGLSSSAALEVATALALGWQGELPSLELALLCQRSDNRFLGIPCGIMDQFVSIFGRPGSAIQLDCRSLEGQPARLPAGIALVAANSRVHHQLGQSAYRSRVEECASAAAALGVETLRDGSLAQLNRIPDPTLRRRARHVFTENLRVLSFVAAAKRDDIAAMGQLMLDSHRSLRDDYEVSCPELDFLVAEAMKINCVWGARVTGGGFGGCTINLLRPDGIDNFQETMFRKYRDQFGLELEFYKVNPSGGAERIF